MTPARFIELRRQLGLSVYKTAQILGISQSQAHRYEHGRSPISEPAARLLLAMAYFGLPQELIGKDSKPPG
jgi:transcriptional regulator with XRE-family HTH domain